AGRPTGWNGGPGPPVATGPPSPPVLYAHFNATTTNGDSRLILISLHVAGAERPLRALLDSGATNNFVRDDCLALLPSHVSVREGPGEIVVKLADGKPHRAPRRAVSLAYAFDGFSTNDDFLVIDLNYAFDCILGMPWLARYQPEIDWLARSVRRRVGYDVSEVFTHLLVAPSRHVAVVDRTSTTQPPPRESDGPRCVECAASSIRSNETLRQSPKPPKLPELATLQSRDSEATSRPYETTFRRDGPPPLVNATGARRWIAERIVDHETRRTRATGTVQRPVERARPKCTIGSAGLGSRQRRTRGSLVRVWWRISQTS
ncbi:hypothetical protein PR003_g33048, partial [Phytophthora rubi]